MYDFSVIKFTYWFERLKPYSSLKCGKIAANHKKKVANE